MLNNKSLLITGGTGTFGSMFLKKILQKYKKIKRLVILSRDEFKQSELSEKYPSKKYHFIRFYLGDMRDKDRLKSALDQIDIVIHAAALKQVPRAEFNPTEYIKTNIIGANNLIEACLETKVKNVIALSTDKAAAPINLYGATKLCSDKLFIAANNLKGFKNIKFSILRYGNVIASRGSVIPKLIELNKQKKDFVLTDKKMTRFSLTQDQCIDFCLWSISNNIGGEIIVPKIPSYKILDIFKAINPSRKIVTKGVRPGEKIHEEMITRSDSAYAYDIGKFYLILPSNNKSTFKKFKKKYPRIKKVDEDFSYNSKNNKNFLSIKNIKKIINEI